MKFSVLLMDWKPLLLFAVCLFCVVGLVSGRDPPPDPTLKDLECAFCIIALNELEALPSESRNEQYIKEYLLDTVCPILSKDLAYVCDEIADEIPTIFSFIDQHANPGKICEAVSLCTSDPNLPPDGVPLTQWDIDLDLVPEERWKAVANHTLYWSGLWEIANTLKLVFTPEITTPLFYLFDLIYDVLPEPYSSEIKGISDVTGLPVGLVTLLNLFYEVQGGLGCTSIVGQTASGSILWSRNQDLGWGMGFTGILKNSTIYVKFYKQGEVVYEGVTFAGYIGLPTSFMKNKWMASINARFYPYSFLTKLKRLGYEFLTGGANVASWLLRDAVDAGDDFETAVERLSHSRLAADVYYILGGVKPGEGVVISRNLTNAQDVWRVNATAAGNGGWFLVQTNYDHWKSPPFYDDRRFYAIKAMEQYCSTDGGKHAGADFDLDCLHHVLSTKPVLNIQTCYTAQGYPPTNNFVAEHRECTGPCAE
eukprot:TRINITY_DN2478_c0_g1_i1.p1 TRINITY_DN2478_c0_g1~~TRINITY_DN2478_c0_g1_i1.p1  ORF type:complete len:480 (-),score=67.15 TRINITY_DN2478_c0_g1_i1:87-1526(-)